MNKIFAGFEPIKGIASVNDVLDAMGWKKKYVWRKEQFWERNPRCRRVILDAEAEAKTAETIDVVKKLVDGKYRVAVNNPWRYKKDRAKIWQGIGTTLTFVPA